jgi:hypothetical protein
LSVIKLGIGHLFISTGDLAQLERIVQLVVTRSGELRPQRLYTEGAISEDEYKRRAKFCVDTALRWRKDRKFAFEQISDELKTALIRWIDGEEYEPRGGMWADPDEPSNRPRSEK